MMHDTITVEHDDNRVIISDDETLCYGEGPDFVSALVDFAQTVLEWYWMSEEDPEDGTTAAMDVPIEYERIIEQLGKSVLDYLDEKICGDEPTILERGNIMRRRGRHVGR